MAAFGAFHCFFKQIDLDDALAVSAKAREQACGMKVVHASPDRIGATKPARATGNDF